MHVAIAAAFVGCAGTACGEPPVVRPAGAAPVRVTAGTLPPGPPRTIDRLPIPPLDGAWAPPSASAGDLVPLAAALRTTPRVAVQLGPRLDGPLWRQRMPTLLGALGLRGEVAMLPSAAIGSTFTGAMPLVRTTDRAPVAPPHWTSEGLRLDDAWRRAHASTDAPVLVIDDAPIDPATWRALPAAHRDSCEAPLQALALGQEQSLAQLEPWLDHVDAVLWQIYRAELRALLPGIADGLAVYAPPRPPGDARDPKTMREHECGHALFRWTQHYRQCAIAKEPCEWAPRMFLVGGARVAAPEPSVFVPDECGDVLGLDTIERVRALGREAAEVAAGHLDEDWVVLADRLGAITEVHAALEDACEPRRRRFAPEDVADARARLVRIGEALASGEPPRAGTWKFDGDRFHVPGVGPVRRFARYDAGPGSAAVTAVGEARALRQFVLSRAVCRGSTGLPLAIALVQPGAEAGPAFFGYVYEEELACAELPPRGVEP
jgi:hypothetical protein